VEREVALAAWGKAVLEEILVRAAQGAAAAPTDAVEVSLTFRLTPSGDGLAIHTPSALEPPLVTHLSRPF
jgi:hypothetical protein